LVKAEGRHFLTRIATKPIEQQSNKATKKNAGQDEQDEQDFCREDPAPARRAEPKAQ